MPGDLLRFLIAIRKKHPSCFLHTQDVLHGYYSTRRAVVARRSDFNNQAVFWVSHRLVLSSSSVFSREVSCLLGDSVHTRKTKSFTRSLLILPRDVLGKVRSANWRGAVKQRFRLVLPSRSMISRHPRFDFSTRRRPTRLQTKSKMILDVKLFEKTTAGGLNPRDLHHQPGLMQIHRGAVWAKKRKKIV